MEVEAVGIVPRDRPPSPNPRSSELSEPPTEMLPPSLPVMTLPPVPSLGMQGGERSPPALPPQPALNAEASDKPGKTKMSMSLPGQIVLHDTEDDDASDGMAVTPIPTGRSDTFTARSGGDFGHTQSIGGGRKSIAEYHDPGRESRKSIKAQKDARMRGMSTDQLYTRRSGVAPPPVASASSTPSTPNRSRNNARYQDNFFVKREQVEHTTWLGRLHPAVLVRSAYFETVFCVVIVLNMVVMSFEVQYQGLDTGQKIGFPLYNLPARDLWPGAEQVFTVTSWFFGVIFAVEIVLRAVGWGPWKFPFDFWNWFDAGMVALWILSETYFQSLDERIIRLARTARLFRLVKVIRMIHGFDSLYLMMTAMRGSLAVLFWSFILLLVAQIMIAFLLNQVLSATYLLDENKSISDRQEVFAYFGTCSRAILSMFELTLGNWPVIARVLQDKVSEWYFLFAIAHKVTIGFAVIGVINGVFMQETFKVAGSDDKIMMRQRERERKLHTKKMKVLFEHADESGDGILDMEEFIQVLENPSVRTWLAAQDLSINSDEASANLFRLLDDGDAALTAQELVEGVARLKGPAKSMDLAVFKLDFLKFKEDVGKIAELVEKLSGETVAGEGFATAHRCTRKSVLKE
ncbi:unnamed protein product [Durusdinium trenchii]|uniref:EF-hand domain-containing protein n=1 Tax=Durusdinium trenchii TaxID=1381693 RepID=A0ABP0R4C2_9DINO